MIIAFRMTPLKLHAEARVELPLFVTKTNNFFVSYNKSEKTTWSISLPSSYRGWFPLLRLQNFCRL